MLLMLAQSVLLLAAPCLVTMAEDKEYDSSLGWGEMLQECKHTVECGVW